MSFNKTLLFSELFSSKFVNLIMDIGRNRVRRWEVDPSNCDNRPAIDSCEYEVCCSVTQILASLTENCINANTVSQTSTMSDNCKLSWFKPH
jgi:hypothetical protein